MKQIVINESYGAFTLSEEGAKYYNSFSPIKLSIDNPRAWGVNGVIYYLGRDDPNLIKTITDLKEKAAAPDCKLKIAEVPDGYNYRIEEYDGLEHVVLLPREDEIRKLCANPDALIEYLRRSDCFDLNEEPELLAPPARKAMDYTMELTFSPDANMEEMLGCIREVCLKSGCGIIKYEDNTIIYGATEFEKYAVAYVRLGYVEEIKPYLVEAIWFDKKEGAESCLENILKEV
ncbi:hypothetical protein D081_1943 [Anaerovibrio sp. JC8]|uniref:hypothetical protein n=1 Tax=Anaerovibrio sp. JC8 TaxID=1240085 RepID=UPI000A0A8DB9|nr:hypothetical protein [Anaerovibrio sp. JC8]ORT99391.1 hypothetical protein D081_1943 [Anaerovibrio sp. JC8]